MDYRRKHISRFLIPMPFPLTLLLFFLTYRTYISPVDLAHLFICRFHWALMDETGAAGGNGGGTGTDDRVKGIVRLRTFVALRHLLDRLIQQLQVNS